MDFCVPLWYGENLLFSARVSGSFWVLLHHDEQEADGEFSAQEGERKLR